MSSKTRVYAGLSTDVVRDVSFQNGSKDLLASWLGQRYGRRFHERDEIVEEGKPQRRECRLLDVGCRSFNFLCEIHQKVIIRAENDRSDKLDQGLVSDW